MLIYRTAAIALTVALSAPARADALMPPDRVAQLVGEAFAYGDMCSNWTVDERTLSRFLMSQEVRLDDRYRETMLSTRRRYEAAAVKLDPRKACDKAIRAFGPVGEKVPGLLKLK